MFVVEIDRSRRFVVISVAGYLAAEDARDAARRVREIVAEAEPGFVALADFRWLDAMATGAAPFIADIMDAFVARKVSAVVRVVPDPRKDIGLNILSQFHYGPDIRVITFETLADAVTSIAGD
jgi:hypothetical protein